MAMIERKRVNSGTQCCVINCPNSGKRCPPGTHFYRFPALKHLAERRKKWITAVRRQNPDGSPWQPGTDRICSEHFVGNKKSEHPLSPSYNPTIFPTVYRKRGPSSDIALKRFERSIKRKKSAPSQAITHMQAQEQSCPFVEKIPQCSSLPVTEVNHNVSKDCVDIDTIRKVDSSTQINLLDEEDRNYALFVCIKYNNVHTCDAELQALIPTVISKIEIFPENIKQER